MNRVTVTGHGGVPLSVLTAGDPANPPILLIHGYSQAALSWSRQLDALSDRFHVVAPDLRGHGASGKPQGDEHYDTPEPWARDVEAVITALNLDRPVLVGWSMGGHIAQDYVSVCGDGAIAGLVLIGTGVTKGKFLPEAAKAARAADDAVSAAGMLSEDHGENIAATLGFIRACTADPMDAEDFAAAAAFNMACPPAIRKVCRTRPGDYRAVMAGVKVPVLVMWGDQERLSHRSMFDEMMATIPGAEPRIYPGLGHMPFFEDPAAFNADLAAFATRVQSPMEFRSNSDGDPTANNAPRGATE